MSLLSTLQISNNSLIATQTGLQVVANNIANANTPGYTRQEIVLEPGTTQQIGTLTLGLGVQIKGIVQQTDRFINERLRSAISDFESTSVQKQAYQELEAILGELTDTDLSTTLNEFFASIQDVLNQPEDLATRNLAALQGKKLADEIIRFDGRVREIRKDLNNTIVGTATDINRLTTEIAKLNVQIVALESGSAGASDAGGLRDLRSTALGELAKILGVRTTEQESGAISVYSNGDYLVYDGTSRPVKVVYEEDRGLTVAAIHLVDSDSPINTSSGSLTGMYEARDEVLGGFLDKLDDFSQKLIFEFNKVFSSGQGLTGYSTLDSEHQATTANAALDSAGLPYTPVNGMFQVLVQNKRTGLTTTTDVRVDLNGLGDDTTLSDLVSQLDAVEGVAARINATGGLTLDSESPVLEFSFANDTSGILAALGINTFFSGTAAIGIGVNAAIRNDPSKFAASRGGIGADSANAVALAGLTSQALDSTGGLTLTEYYERFTAEVFQASAVMQGINDGFATFRATLEGQQLGISGVNVDEQAIQMLQFQRAFQASARLVSTINELLETLVNL